MLLLLALVTVLVALDVLAILYGADSRPMIGDSHRQQSWPATLRHDLG